MLERRLTILWSRVENRETGHWTLRDEPTVCHEPFVVNWKAGLSHRNIPFVLILLCPPLSRTVQVPRTVKGRCVEDEIKMTKAEGDHERRASKKDEDFLLRVRRMFSRFTDTCWWGFFSRWDSLVKERQRKRSFKTLLENELKVHWPSDSFENSPNPSHRVNKLLSRPRKQTIWIRWIHS